MSTRFDLTLMGESMTEHKGVEHVIPCDALVVIMMQCRGWSMMLQMGWGRWWMKNVPSR